MNSITFRELTPVTFLERAAAVFGDLPAVVDGEFSSTYSQFWLRGRQLAGLLSAKGVQPGDRVAVLAPNTHMLLEAHYGVPLAGAVLVALNTRLSATEISYILDHSEASVVLADDDLLPVLTDSLRHCRRAISVVSSGEYEQLLAAAEPRRIEVTDERSMLSINYTSGTTGRPKGVVYHHRGAYLQALAMAYHAKLDTSSRYLWTLPMFHTNGWCFPWAVTAAGGVQNCLRKVNADMIWDAIDNGGVTHFCAAPTVLSMMADARSGTDPVHNVRVLSGGAPPWPALLERMDELGIEIRHLYGLTETFGPAVVSEWQPQWDDLPVAQRARLTARQGIANIVAEPVRVIDSGGSDVPADGHTLGEIAMRGNDVMLGYYRDAAATAAATTHDGWFRSGDLGVMHPDGYVELRDRIKDVIISGGENITSVEVENALTEHPDVLEAAVVGVPDVTWGEVPIAFVELREGSETEGGDLVEFVKTRIARFKAPRRVYVRALPKTSTGKVSKNTLRSWASDQGPA